MTDTVMSAEYARQCFSYNAETGDLIWKRRPLEHFKNKRYCTAWNTRFFGKKAGSIHVNGYLRIAIYGKIHVAHRICWLLTYGEWPKKELDHINHDRLDNRIVNLREVIRKENGRNLSKKSNNTSGVTGVSWDRQRNKWRAYAYIDQHRANLGRFSNIEDAAAIVAATHKASGYHENHGK